MITVKELRSMFNQCPNDWTIEFRKWEHGDSDDFKKKYPNYPMPNLVSINVKKVVTYTKSNYELIVHKFVLEDDFDNDFTLTKDEALEYFCWGYADFEMVEFELCTETDGNVPLKISLGDKGYSDKVQMITFDEI